MPVITISRGSYSAGKAVAEEVAERLGYDCISRDIETETLKTFDIPEAALSLVPLPSLWLSSNYPDTPPGPPSRHLSRHSESDE